MWTNSWDSGNLVLDKSRQMHSKSHYSQDLIPTVGLKRNLLIDQKIEDFETHDASKSSAQKKSND